MAFNPLHFVKEEIAELDQVKNRESLSRGSIGGGFLGRIRYASKLIFLEKEIVIFSLLQIVVVAAAYYFWVQILDWIPENVWRSTENSKEGSIADLVFLLWSFVCVGLAAFPMGLLSGCIGAAHFLHRSGKRSTFASCMDIVFSRAWSIWIFTWADGWITVNQILKRLPKKRDRRTPAEKALSETLYYAWKLGTMGILPSLLTGKNLVDSGKNAVLVVKAKILEFSKLRLGYSAVCWLIGILAYVGAFLFIVMFDPMPHKEVYGKIYELYVLIGFPIVLAVGIIQIFLRPIYLISLCDIYSDYLKEKGEEAVLPNTPNRVISAAIVFIILCLVTMVAFLYRHELRIMEMLGTPYGKTYAFK